MTHWEPASASCTLAQAAVALGVNHKQGKKLLGCGLLTPASTPGQVERSSVDRLTGWATRGPLPDDVAGPILMVHLGPLVEANDGERRVRGYHANPPEYLSQRDLDDAWMGNWPVREENADRLIGSVLLGDVSGFVPEKMVRVVTGWRHVLGGRVRFVGHPPDAATVRAVTRRYVRPQQGALWQWVR